MRRLGRLLDSLDMAAVVARLDGNQRHEVRIACVDAVDALRDLEAPTTALGSLINAAIRRLVEFGDHCSELSDSEISYIRAHPGDFDEATLTAAWKGRFEDDR
jgi:hypothetical protein